MRVLVMKPFPCALEPHKVETLAKGRIVVLGDHIDRKGLLEGGFVKKTAKGQVEAAGDDEA